MQSEKFEGYSRISSCVSRYMYDRLAIISDNIDFRHFRFADRMKRNRSLGSTLAFVAELALQDEAFVKRLRSFMVDGGKHYTHNFNYYEKY